MELWIRTQDKESLVKVEFITISYNYEDEKLKNKQLYYIDSDTIRLGSYKTKERALEVLDEIQDRLINLQNYGEKIGNYIYESPCIYEMPQE